MCRQDTKELMICINNKYGLIQFTKINQINHYFSYISTKTSCVIGIILNWGAVQSRIMHTLTQDVVHHSTLEFEINLTQSSCKLKKCFSYIIQELLNWYWWILALVGFKMHQQAHAFYSQLMPIFTFISSITLLYLIVGFYACWTIFSCVFRVKIWGSFKIYVDFCHNFFFIHQMKLRCGTHNWTRNTVHLIY